MRAIAVLSGSFLPANDQKTQLDDSEFSMRFCFVSTQKNWGGGEDLMLQLARQLQELGHVVCWVARRGTDVLERLSDDSGEVIYAARSRHGGIVDWFRLRRQLRKWSPDVVVLNDTHSVTLAGPTCLWWGKSQPLRVAYKHTIFPLRSATKYRWLSDQVACVSEAARRVVVDGGLDSSLASVVPGGCPPPDVDPGRSLQIREELGVSTEGRLLVAVGSLIDVKGHSELIDAFARQQRSDLVLAIAGTGPNAKQLQQQADTLGVANYVKLLGYRDDVNNLIDAADLLVHPSHSEGLSLVLIQAKMLATPIVATRVGGACEVLDTGPEKQLGFWPSQPKDTDSLASALERALETLKQPPSGFEENLREAQTRTLERFNIRSSALGLVQLVERMREAS